MDEKPGLISEGKEKHDWLKDLNWKTITQSQHLETVGNQKQFLCMYLSSLGLASAYSLSLVWA